MGLVRDGHRLNPPQRGGSNGKFADAQDRVKLYIDGEAPLDVLGDLEGKMDLRGAVKIGAGSFSDVLLMKELAGDNWIAVKAISLSKARSTLGSDTRLRHEVRVMRELDHPNLVKLLDVVVCRRSLAEVENEPPYLCICMEYVAESEPLSNAIRRGGAQPHLVSQVGPQLASVLALMHSRGLVHRDVWSENVLVARNGHVVLVDLGCAEYFQTGPTVCTKLNVPYMSPEAAQGDRQHPGDDCWCLGLLMCEMATGRFVADRIGNCSTPIHHVPDALSEAIRETSALAGSSIGRICTMLLSLDGACRPSMAEVIAQLGALRSPIFAANTQPIQPPPVRSDPPCRTPRPIDFAATTLTTSKARRNSLRGGQALGSRLASASATSSATGSSSLGSESTSSYPSAMTVPAAVNSAEDGGSQAMNGPARRSPAQTGAASASSNNNVLSWLSQVATPLSLWGSTGTSNSTSSALLGQKPTGHAADAVVQPLGSSVLVTAASALQVGQTINYLARSNGMWYPGLIVGRAGSSWQVKLDCGLTKEVDDRDSWRINARPSHP